MTDPYNTGSTTIGVLMRDVLPTFMARRRGEVMMVGDTTSVMDVDNIPPAPNQVRKEEECHYW